MAKVTPENEVLETADEAIARIEGELVPIYLPLEGAGGENVQWVGFNGKTWTIPRGKTTYVPRALYNLIRQREHAQREAREFNERGEKRLNDPAMR